MTRKRLLIALALLVALVLGLLALLNTEWALQRGLALLQAGLPGELQVTQAQGRLLGVIELRGVEYRDDSVHATLESLRLDWSPSALLRSKVHVDVLRIEDLQLYLQPADSAVTPEDDAAAFDLPAIRLPLGIQIDDLQLTRLTLHPPGADALVIDSLHMQAAARGSRIKLRQFELKGFDARLALSGELRLRDDYPLALDTDWQYAPEGRVVLAGQGRVEGNLRQLRITQDLSGAAEARLQARLDEPLADLHWDLQLQLTQFNAGQFNPDWPAVQLKGELQSQGKPDNFTLNSELQGELPETGPLSAKLVLAQQAGQWRIEQLVLQQLHTEARLEVSGSFVQGTDWRKDPGEFDLRGNWQGLVWPLTAHVEPQFASPRGEFSLTGRLDAYQLNLAGELAAADLPQAQLELQGRGGREALNIEQLKLATLGGQVQGRLQLEWDLDTLDWRTQGDLHARRINPGLHWVQWPGQLNARATFSASQAAGERRANLRLRDIKGQLRDYPLDGEAQLVILNDSLRVPALSLRIADARLELHGGIDAQWDLRWQLQAPDLAALWPGAEGSVNSKGQIQGPRLRPHVQGEVRGSGLIWQNQRIGRIDVEADADFAADGSFAVYAAASELWLYGQHARHFTLDAGGTGGAHQIRLEAANPDEQLYIALWAGMATDGRWSGELTQADVQLQHVGDWQLQQASAFHVAADSAQLAQSCWQQAQARFCVEGDWRTGADATLSINGHALPLAGLGAWLPRGTSISGKAQLELAARYHPDRGVRGEAGLHLDDMVFTLPDTDSPISFSRSRLQLEFADSGFSAELHLPLRGGGGLDAQVSLPDWQARAAPAPQQPLAGTLRINRFPLQLAGGMTPAAARIEGWLEANLQLGGTLADPELQGSSRIEQGRVELPGLGVILTEISATAQSRLGGRVDYELSARSNGQLRISGHTELSPQQGWPSQLLIEGEDFEVLNLREALVRVSPRLELRLAGRELDLQGDVLVPRARLRPRGLPEGTVSVSQDVIIIDDGSLLLPEDRWQLNARLRLRLGEHVDFDGFGLRGRLVGQLLLIDEPGRLTVAQGEVSIVDGVYQMRGQNLEIRRGRLIFANSVVDDPGIDVEAVRVVGDVTAGVRVRGRLKRPELTVFSVPNMAESDALAYLLLGRPLTQSTSEEGQQLQQAAIAVGLIGGDFLAREVGGRLGLDEVRLEAGETAEQTALVMGKYLSPKLYVRYVTGIIESSNIVQLRYQLTPRLQLQTEGGYRSNQGVTGADIIYTIEY